MIKYGNRDDVTKVFSGIGAVSINEREYGCSFVAHQKADGKIGLECSFPDTECHQGLDLSLHEYPQKLSFAGATYEQQIVRLSGIRLEESIHGSTYTLYLGCSSLMVESESDRLPLVACFQMTNLEFSGTQPYTTPLINGERRHSSQLPLLLGERSFTIRPLPNYNDTLRCIRKTRGVGATAEIVTPIESLAETGKAREAVDDICILLSLAAGCRVAAMNCQITDREGHVISFVGREVPTKRYSFHIIPIGDLHRVSLYHGESIRRFIESAFAHLSSAKERWAVHKAIEYYLDAKREGDEFEFWGLKMVVCMEFLRNQRLKHKGEDCIVSMSAFRRLSSRILKPRLKEILQEGIVGITPDQIASILERVCELNRYSFGKTLGEMNQETGARISDVGVRRFVRIRNALVHQGHYDLRYGTPGEQYSFLDRYIYEFILSTLGHPIDSIWAESRWESDGSPVIDSLKQDLF